MSVCGCAQVFMGVCGYMRAGAVECKHAWACGAVSRGAWVFADVYRCVCVLVYAWV